MAIAAFVTLTVSKNLQQAGLEERHAEAIALAVKQGQGDLATKQDIALLKFDIDHLKSGNEQLKSDQMRTEMQSDFAWVRRLLFADLALKIVIFVAVVSGNIAQMSTP